MKSKKIKLSKANIAIIVVVILTFISLGIYILKINNSARSLEKYTEITFVNPNQAIIFWKSEEPTLGYVKYGDSKYGRKAMELQTSSEPGELHVVFLDRIPPEGIYISKHLDSSNILIFPKIEFIKYDKAEAN